MAPTIPHDAIVAVDSSQTDHSQLDNKIVVAWDEKNGVSISRFRRYRGVEVLEPENRGYESVANVTNRTGSGRQDSSLTAEIAFRRLVGEAVQARNFLRITPRSPSAPLPKSTRLEGSGTGEDCEIVSLQPGGAAGPTQRRFRWKHPQLSEKYVPKPFTFLKVVKNPLKEGMVDAESLLQSLVTPAVPNKKHSVLPETTTVA